MIGAFITVSYTHLDVYKRQQHTSKGSVPGISGNVDLNVTTVNYPKIIRKKGLTRLREGLAVQVIAERAFEPIGEAAFRRAARVLQSCGKVVCCLDRFGAANEKNRLLAEMGRDRLCGPEEI